jgi:hypothetical protein
MMAPIANVKLAMMTLAAVLVAQHFPRKVDDWEGLPTKACTWQAWKVAFCLAHLKCQCHLQSSGGGKTLNGAHTVILGSAPTINRIGAAHEHLALAALNDTNVLQQLMAANLLLTALVTSTLLTTANKKLAEALLGTRRSHCQKRHQARGGRGVQRTRLFREIFARPTVIGSASITRVRPVGTKPWGTRTMQHMPTRWAVAMQTRDGLSAPDGVGVLI